MSRGRSGSSSAVGGHTLEQPARGFRPRRDVDRFLDQDNMNPVFGYLKASDELDSVLRMCTEKSDKSGYLQHAKIIQTQAESFRHWLSESKRRSDSSTFPPFRFSDSRLNRLWEYSPFLCVVGLIQGLEIAYHMGLSLWDRMHEPVLAIHIHNMLVKKGYITKPVGLYEDLQRLLSHVCSISTLYQPETSQASS